MAIGEDLLKVEVHVVLMVLELREVGQCAMPRWNASPLTITGKIYTLHEFPEHKIPQLHRFNLHKQIFFSHDGNL